MKWMLTILCFCSCAVCAHGNVYQMDPRGDAVVEIDKVGGEYKILCTFSPQTKFDSAVNARFNDSKGDSLCKKGIARYLKVGTNDLLTVSGQYSAAPVKNVGGKLRYSFGVPVAGCKVEVGAAKPKVIPPPVIKNTPVVTNNASQVEDPSNKTNEVKTTKTVRSASYLSVVKYQEVNNRRSVVSRREYRGSDFNSQQEFDQLCDSEFARVRALGEQNFRAVLNFGKQKKE